MHYATALIALNLVHKQLIRYTCHMPQNFKYLVLLNATKYLQYYKMEQSQRIHKQYQVFQVRMDDICQIARQNIAEVHNTGPMGQMWPARRLKMARKRCAECSQCFSR